MTPEEEVEAFFPGFIAIKESRYPALCRTGDNEQDCKAIKSIFVYDDLVYEAEPQDVQ